MNGSTMKKTIIFFFLILFFSNNAYSSSCESEFQKPGEGTKILVRAVKEMLEQDQLSPKEQEAIAEFAGKLGKEGAGFLKELLKKNPTSQVQKIIVESAGEIGGEAGASAEVKEAAASVLKALLELEQNLKPYTQNAIAKSAGKIGEEEGASVLKALLEKYLSSANLSPLAEHTIIRSASQIGGELGMGILKDMFEGTLKTLLVQDMPPEVQEAFAEFAGENKTEEDLRASLFVNLDNKGFSFQVRDFIAKSLGRIEEDLRASILQGLLKKNLTSQIQEAIAESAGNLGGEEASVKAKEAAASILKDMLKQNPSPEVQVVILRSAVKIGGEWGESVATDVIEGVLKEMLEKDMPPEVQEAFAELVVENKTSVFANLEKDLSSQEQSFIAESLVRELRASAFANFEKDLSPQELDFIEESIAKTEGELEAFILKSLFKKNPTSQVQKIIAESAGKFGVEKASAEAKEAAASVLKALLEMDIQLELEVQVAIAESAGKLGKAGAGVLKDMLEKNPRHYVQEVIVRSAGEIGAEAREAGAAERQEAEEARQEAVSILKDLLKRGGLSIFTEGVIAKSAGEIGGEEGAEMLKDLLEKDPIFAVRIDIIRSANRIEEETGIKLEGI